MPNSLFNSLNGPDNDILSRFLAFKSSFQGDPKQKVQELLNSGQMTQEQYNALAQRAQQLQGLLK